MVYLIQMVSVLWAKFSNKPLQGTGKYYLTLDPFAGYNKWQSKFKINQPINRI